MCSEQGRNLSRALSGVSAGYSPRKSPDEDIRGRNEYTVPRIGRETHPYGKNPPLAVMETERRTKSEMVREALRRFLEERKWRDLRHYGEMMAMEAGISSEEEVNDIVRNYRRKKD